MLSPRGTGKGDLTFFQAYPGGFDIFSCQIPYPWDKHCKNTPLWFGTTINEIKTHILLILEAIPNKNGRLSLSDHAASHLVVSRFLMQKCQIFPPWG